MLCSLSKHAYIKARRLQPTQSLTAGLVGLAASGGVALAVSSDQRLPFSLKHQRKHDLKDQRKRDLKDQRKHDLKDHLKATQKHHLKATQKQARSQEHKKAKQPHGTPWSEKAKQPKTTLALNNAVPKGQRHTRTDVGSKQRHLLRSARLLQKTNPTPQDLQKSGMVSGRRQTKQKDQWNHLSNRLPSRFGLVYINKTKRNTHCSVSNLFGRQATQWSIRGGQIPGSRRKTRYTLRNVLQATVKKLLALGFDRLVLQVKGLMLGRQFIYKTFCKRKLFKIILFKFNPGIAHNGCRAPKVRRL